MCCESKNSCAEVMPSRVNQKTVSEKSRRLLKVLQRLRENGSVDADRQRRQMKTRKCGHNLTLIGYLTVFSIC